MIGIRRRKCLDHSAFRNFLVVVVLAGAIIWPATRICAKAGYSPWLGVVAIIPIGNVFLLWFLGFRSGRRGGALHQPIRFEPRPHDRRAGVSPAPADARSPFRVAT